MLVKTIHGNISTEEFRRDYLDKNQAVIVKGCNKDWAAIEKWGSDYFKNRFGSASITTKKFLKTGEIKTEKVRLDDYIASLADYENSLSLGRAASRPAYWHDVPIFQIFPELLEDVKPFQVDLLPSFYREGWSRYVQFFMGATGSVTKLHFDTLRTHNLTFQVRGTKIWTLLPPAQEVFCGRKQWRWFEIDPESPDLKNHPEFKNATPVTVTVEAGDLFYVPPGTLHHVRSLDVGISFNIDFHTQSSVINSFRYLHKGMPAEVIYYNTISLLGLVLKVPSRLLFPFYKSYLNYVS